MASKCLFSFSQLVILLSLVFVVEITFATKNTTPTTKPASTNLTTTANTSATTTAKPTNHSSTVAPANQTTAVPPTTSNHTSTTQPGNYSTPLPTTGAPSNTSTVPTHGPTGHSRDCSACEDKLDKERHYKWVAVSFDIIFAIAFIVMLILYLRQRKMYREMEGDGSLSRLI